ncbi:MAG: alpha/beta hydrolase, partial [Pseudonocardia sp.]
VPLYVAQGEADTLVRPQITAAFVAAACTSGVRVTSRTFPVVDHGGIAFDALPSLIPWLAAAGQGTPQASTC